MKKIIWGIAAFTASTSISLSADECCFEQDIQICEQELQCCETSCGTGVIYGDFLYLKATSNGLDYCFSTGFTETEVGDTLVYDFNSTIKNPSSNWNPGFRVGAAWEFSESKLKADAVWTHYNTKASTSLGVQNLHWKLNFDTVDIVARYILWKDSPVFLSVFGGVRLAEINQKTHSFRVNEFLGYTKQDRNKQDFRGAGPLVGLAVDWDLGCRGLGLYFEGDVGALYGCHHAHFNNTIFRVGDIRSQHIHQHTNAYVGVVDAGVGIKWKHEFCNGNVLFVKLGAELHRYFSYNRLGDHDDLCLDGGRLSAGFVF